MTQAFARDYGRSAASYGIRGGDEAGHIIGKQFGGSGTTRENIVPLDYDLNRLPGQWAHLERTIARLVTRDLETVCFKISFQYDTPNRPLRPSSFTWEYMYRPRNAKPNVLWNRVSVGPITNGAPIPP
jgi:hypothetical protein